MSNITVYTTDNCSRCVGAKALLNRRGFGFEEINLTRNPDGRAELARVTGMITFPQIVIDGQSIGGFDQLVAADRAGRLSELVGIAAESPAA